VINPRHLQSVFIARNREFWRDHSALAWNILFPVLLIAGFAFGFSDERKSYMVGVVSEATETVAFLDIPHIQIVELDAPEPGITKIERHQLDLLIDLDSGSYWVNQDSDKGFFLEQALNQLDPDRFSRQPVSGKELRYVDWVVPGILAMNIMFNALFGIGYVIVRYRKNGVLKRLKATPLSALEFLLAQLGSRLWVILVVNSAVYIGCNIFVDFSMHGSYLALLAIFTLGSISLISLGLLVAARSSSEELAGGLLNLISWPMMFLSGVWFSLEGLEPWVQDLAMIFPLTHTISAARAIMIDGASLAELLPQISILAAMSVVFLIIGSFMFKWE
jgi:ABC-type multidrug transport system permease subunit